MKNIMKQLSNNALLFLILVVVVFTYIVIKVEEKNKSVKELFSPVDGSILELENFETKQPSTKPSTQTQPATQQSSTKPATQSSTKPSTKPSTQNVVDPYADGAGDAGSNTDAISEKSSQDIVQTNDKKTTIVHNHYYGGNKELAKFIKSLEEKQQADFNKEQKQLIDQGMCSELNNKLANKTLAEVKNDRLLADLKNKCDQQAMNQSTCKVAPTQDQTALLGTLLTDAKNTQFGSIVAQ
jgi:hypothetical protein